MSRLFLAFLAVLSFGFTAKSHAGSATWKTDPISGDWNTAANWTPATIPNGVSDTAVFQQSNITELSLSSDVEIGAIEFPAGASMFTLKVGPQRTLTVRGQGIVNDNSEFSQIFVLQLAERAGHGARVRFVSGTADNSTVFVSGSSIAGGDPAAIFFLEGSSAGSARLYANGGSNGGAGGLIKFLEGSSGGRARVILSGNATLDVTHVTDGHPNATLNIASLYGDGFVFLGATPLSIGGGNGFSGAGQVSNFSGLIADGPSSEAVGGSLTKVGDGKLVLSHANTYTGGTTVKNGKLIINNNHRSGTGSGPVQIERGILGGTGIIAGPVTMGTGSDTGAYIALAPGLVRGAGRIGTLTINSPLTFNSDSIYAVQLNSFSGTGDQVSALGVTINSGAQISVYGTGAKGTVFTVINNTSANPIAGTFSNLPDGSIFQNTFKVNYEGGDGNDLTLTVQ